VKGYLAWATQFNVQTAPGATKCIANEKSWRKFGANHSEWFPVGSIQGWTTEYVKNWQKVPQLIMTWWLDKSVHCGNVLLTNSSRHCPHLNPYHQKPSSSSTLTSTLPNRGLEDYIVSTKNWPCSGSMLIWWRVYWSWPHYKTVSSFSFFQISSICHVPTFSPTPNRRMLRKHVSVSESLVRSSEQVAPNEFDIFDIASREKPVIYEWIYMSSFPVWDKSSVPQFSHQGSS